MTFAIRWREDASGFVGPHAGKLASQPPHFLTEGEAETVRLGMPNAEYAEVIVVPDVPEQEWVFDDAARARVTAALAEIDANQAHLPTCALCGQRSLKLDRFGLCSKVSQPPPGLACWRARRREGRSEPMSCAFDGCGRPVKAHGLCNGHNEQRRLGRPMRPLTETPRGTLAERVAAYTRKLPSDGCWEWTGPRNELGYGKLRVNGRDERAHRVVYELEVGPIPVGMVLDHSCHNTSCVNPAHLRPRTQKENMENLSGAHRDSKSGIRGVHWSERRRKWIAQVASGGEKYRAAFDSIEEAERAAIAKRNELHTNNLADRRADS